MVEPNPQLSRVDAWGFVPSSRTFAGEQVIALEKSFTDSNPPPAAHIDHALAISRTRQMYVILSRRNIRMAVGGEHHGSNTTGADA
ncbi:hypothetical protein CKO23_13365 [Thiocystis violacea]|nr:hypothetical protein [Thiocystis violacea]